MKTPDFKQPKDQRPQAGGNAPHIETHHVQETEESNVAEEQWAKLSFEHKLKLATDALTDFLDQHNHDGKMRMVSQNQKGDQYEITVKKLTTKVNFDQLTD